MWTQASRGRTAECKQRAKRYPTNLTDEEWPFIQPFLPPVLKRDRKPTTDLREVLDALRYLARTGGGWQMLPNDFRLCTRSTGDSGGSSAGCCCARSTMSR